MSLLTNILTEKKEQEGIFAHAPEIFMGFEIRRVLDVNSIPGGDNATSINIESLDDKKRRTLKYFLLTYFDDGKIKKVLEVDEQKQLRAFVGKEITKSKLESLLKLFDSLNKTERRVLKDITPLIKTVVSNTEAVACDINYIKEIILPPFVQLYEKCRAGYDLLTQKMKNRFKIKITKYDCFEIHGGGESGDSSSQGIAARYVNDLEEKSSKIYINAFHKFSPSISREALYHELMHAIGDLAVNDSGYSGYRLSDYFDAIYEGKLTRLAAQYTKKQDKAALDYTGWNTLYLKIDILGKKISKKEFDVFYKKYRETMKKPEFGCWGNIEKREDTSPEEFIGICFGDTDNAEELLARALAAYYGPDECKEALLKHDPWLYGLIRDHIDARLKKKSPETLNGMRPAQYNNQFSDPDIFSKEYPEFEIKKVWDMKLKQIPIVDGEINILQLDAKGREKLEKVLLDYFDYNSNLKLNAMEQFAVKTNFGSVITASELDQIDKIYKERENRNCKIMKRAMKSLENKDPKKRKAAIDEILKLYHEVKRSKKKEIIKELEYVSKKNKNPDARKAAAEALKNMVEASSN